MKYKKLLQELRAMQVRINEEVDGLHKDIDAAFKRTLNHSFKFEKYLIKKIKGESEDE